MSGVDIAVSVVAKLLEYIAQPILQPFDYIIHHDRNINRLRTQIACLENTRFGYQQQVDVATRNGDIVLPVVQDWINKATALATESHNLLSDCDHSCPHLKLMYKTSRDAKKKRMAVSELLVSGKFDIFSHPAPLLPKGHILKWNVAKQADANQLFDEMVMVVVSHKPNLRKLQGDLAEMLELNLKEEGLPLAIVTVARALRYRSKHAWRDALRQLRSSTMNNVKGMYVFLDGLKEQLRSVLIASMPVMCSPSDTIILSPPVSNIFPTKHVLSEELVSSQNASPSVPGAPMDVSQTRGVSSSQIVLSNLKSIKLEFLPTLRSFCSEAYASLASDDIQEPLFNSKVDFPSLEELTLRELHSVKKIWRSQLSAANFRSTEESHGNLVHDVEWGEIDSVERRSLSCVSNVFVNFHKTQLMTQIAALPFVRDLNLGKLPLMKHLMAETRWTSCSIQAIQYLKFFANLMECDCYDLLCSVMR
ncbi:hypothetical protein Tco_0921600 [Tanacetum coccineum]